jgi:hypothetical protein
MGRPRLNRFVADSGAEKCLLGDSTVTEVHRFAQDSIEGARTSLVVVKPDEALEIELMNSIRLDGAPSVIGGGRAKNPFRPSIRPSDISFRILAVLRRQGIRINCPDSRTFANRCGLYHLCWDYRILRMGPCSLQDDNLKWVA